MEKENGFGLGFIDRKLLGGAVWVCDLFTSDSSRSPPPRTPSSFFMKSAIDKFWLERRNKKSFSVCHVFVWFMKIKVTPNKQPSLSHSLALSFWLLMKMCIESRASKGSFSFSPESKFYAPYAYTWSWRIYDRNLLRVTFSVNKKQSAVDSTSLV